MSERFELSVQRWYNETRTANLEFLDLATNTSIQNICLNNNHNIAVIYDRLMLFTRVSIKNFKELQETQLQIQEEQRKELNTLNKRVKILEEELKSHKPLTTDQVRSLVKEIAAQPKLVEEQALKLTTNLEQRLKEVHELLHEAAESESYAQALSATESLASPAVGFLDPEATTKGVAALNSALVRQNNTIIFMLVSIGEKLNNMEKEPPERTKEDLDEVIQKLSSLKISDGTRPKTVKGPGKVFFYKDPKTAADQERKNAQVQGTQNGEGCSLCQKLA